MIRVNAAAIAQLVEHIIRNDGVAGSNPVRGTNKIKGLAPISRPPPQIKSFGGLHGD
jgi:hypothetical protein